eukprot:2168044-Pyramimonas_sp.AAC.1
MGHPSSLLFGLLALRSAGAPLQADHEHRPDVRVTFRQSDLWCGPTGVPRSPRDAMAASCAVVFRPPARPARSRAPKATLTPGATP